MRTIRILAGGRVTAASDWWKDRDGYWSTSMDPDEIRDLTIDWTGWLEGDTITTSTFTPDGITENSESNTTTSATCWLTAPNDPYGSTVNEIETTAGRTKRMTVRIYYKDV